MLPVGSRSTMRMPGESWPSGKEGGAPAGTPDGVSDAVLATPAPTAAEAMDCAEVPRECDVMGAAPSFSRSHQNGIGGSTAEILRHDAQPSSRCLYPVCKSGSLLSR